MKQRVEILAPAGSWESMTAAVSAGADAVYMGGSRFGARAYADNPQEDRFLDAIDYVHLHGCKIYMTVNTLVKKGELDSLFDFIKPYDQQGLDAAIVQDLGVLAFLKRYFPDLHLHASTQMTITGVGGARILKDLGATRIVTARELSLEEIAKIHSEVDMDIESFVHGALCYCYSGQCLMSSLIGGRSGNRGRCAQPCRLPYDITREGTFLGNKKDRYVLSLKDLCTLDLIPQILKSGVTSLKIEGRMKSPRYTAGVVSIYRKYVDRYLEYGDRDYRVDSKDRDMLLDLFDRGGFTEGYYREHNGRNMVSLKEKPAFREGNQTLFDYLDRTYVKAEKKEFITGKVTLKEGEPVTLSLCLRQKEGVVEAFVSASVAETAKNQPLTREKLEKQICKTGDSPFLFESLDVELSGAAFLPVQALNQLRRDGLAALTQKLLGSYRREGRFAACNTDGDVIVSGQPPQMQFATLIEHLQMLQTVQKHSLVRLIYLEATGFDARDWKQIVESTHKAGKQCALAFPHIFRQEAQQYFERYKEQLMVAKFDAFLVRNLETIDFLKQQGMETHMVFDSNLYAMNHMARMEWAKLGAARQTLSLELNRKELEAFGASGGELIGYGYLPVMISAQCILKTTFGCEKKPQLLHMKDRMQKSFLVKNHCKFCYNVIDNPSPLSLLSQADQICRLNLAFLRLQFTVESEAQMGRVLDAYEDVFRHGKQAKEPILDFTRGHWKRGVE